MRKNSDRLTPVRVDGALVRMVETSGEADGKTRGTNDDLVACEIIRRRIVREKMNH